MFRKIEISIQTILFTLAIIAGIWLLLQIEDILFLIFISFLLMTAIYPLVTWLERFKIPRALGTLLTYFFVLGVLGLAVGSAVPALVAQSATLAATLPATASRLLPYWNINFQTLTSQIAPLSSNVVSVTLGIFSNIFTTFMVLIITFYLIIERRSAEGILTEFLGEAVGKQVSDILRVIERRLGAWVRGQLFLMICTGVLTYVGLILLHVEFALPLAIIAAILPIVPIIGPIVSAIPAVLIGVSVSPLTALLVVILYFVIQQVVGTLLFPVVMQRSAGISPLVTILALLIGARLGGIGGVVLAVPIVIVIQVISATFLGAKNPAS